MKHLSVFFACAVAFVSTPAAEAAQRDAHLPHPAAPTYRLLHHSAPAAHITRAADDTPITEVEGTHSLYSKSADGYTAFMEYVMPYEHADDVAHVVYGADGAVYLYDIISNGRTGTYAQGTLSGQTITVSLPQTMYVYEGGETLDGLRLTLINVAIDEKAGTIEATRNTEVTSVTYTVAEDGTISLDPLPEGTILGYTYISDDTWASYGDFHQTLTPFTTPAPVIPQEAPIETWAMVYDYQGYPIPVMREGDTFYFGGIAPQYAAYWVQGTLKDGKITVANNQYLGLAEDDYFLYGMLGTPYVDDFGDFAYELLPADATLTFTYDEAAKTITCDDANTALLINRGQYVPNTLAAVTAPQFLVQETFAGTPADPMDLDYTEDYREDYNFGVFYFTIPQVSTTGTLLNPKYLFYNIFIDGEVYEFVPEESFIDEAMTDVPFLYDNGLDFFTNGLRPIEREIGIYPYDATTVGVQSVYRFGDVETRSNIVTLNLKEENAVAGVQTSRQPIGYTDLFGRTHTTPQRGLNIVRHADGTTSKVMLP